MHSNEFLSFVESNRPRLETSLRDWLPISTAAGTERYNEALERAVFPGGKRLRPQLTLLGAGAGGASREQSLLLATAMEFIHTSSILFDDLPAMDDAKMRRNSPALHMIVGEGMAILAAVALLNQAYRLFAECAQTEDEASRLPRLIKEATACIGNSGMVAGQATELAFSGQMTDAPALLSRQLKTAGLMRLMMVAGGTISGAPDHEINALATFGECLGKAYQIYDDLGDVMGERETVGKCVGQDLRHQRPTDIEGMNEDDARLLAAGIIQTGKDALNVFGERDEVKLLKVAADSIVNGFNSAAVA